jgi:hypothetical protein
MIAPPLLPASFQEPQMGKVQLKRLEACLPGLRAAVEATSPSKEERAAALQQLRQLEQLLAHHHSMGTSLIRLDILSLMILGDSSSLDEVCVHRLASRLQRFLAAAEGSEGGSALLELPNDAGALLAALSRVGALEALAEATYEVFSTCVALTSVAVEWVKLLLYLLGHLPYADTTWSWRRAPGGAWAPRAPPSPRCWMAPLPALDRPAPALQ